ncbi:unnamed protein product, partial [marine sediment metagenome]
MTDAVKVVCEADDPCKDQIARQLNVIHSAVEMDMLVGISCVNEDGRDVTVLAVM